MFSYFKRRKMQNEIKLFLQSKRTRSPRTVEFYEQRLRFFLEYLDRTKSHTWPMTPEVIEAYLGDCQERGLADGTVRANFVGLRTFFNWLERTGRIDRNPIRLVDTPRAPEHIPRAPARAAIDEILAWFDSQIETALRRDDTANHWPLIRDRTIFSVSFGTGVRVGELEWLTWSNVDFAKRVIRVTKGKSKRERPVLFSNTVRGDLRLWQSVSGNLDISSSVREYLFVSWYNGRWCRLTGSGVRQMFRRRCAEAGIERFTPHQLRHAFAGETLINGGNLEQIKVQLGHTNIATTSIYTLMTPEVHRQTHDDTSPI